jgi:hypothetical protein
VARIVQFQVIEEEVRIGQGPPNSVKYVYGLDEEGIIWRAQMTPETGQWRRVLNPPKE